MKYPRTYHLPTSPGSTSDDKKLKDVDFFISKDKDVNIVFTEKLDGSNACLTVNNVFSRSHNQNASHKSFNYLKAIHSQVKSLIKHDEFIFGEYCYAVHSITYNELPSYFFVFGIKIGKTWLSFEDVQKRTKELGLIMVPLLFEGSFYKEKEFFDKVDELASQPSFYGGEKEGIVCRLKNEFNENDFSKSIAKWVRKNHVQTDDHWMFQEIIKQKISKK